VAPAEAGESQSAPVSDALPLIREATPVGEPGGPSLPSVAAAVQRPAAPSPFEFDSASVAAPPTRQPRGGKKRSGLKLVATITVLGGLVAAGVVFGQPYLFPSEWDEAAAPYAEAVESSRGIDFAEPLAVTAEPSAAFADRLQAQLAPVSPEMLTQWRALGLSTGVVDDTTLARQLAGWQDAVYSTADGQVYHDLGAAGDELDAQLVQTMAAVSLDQEFAWSADQQERTLDAAAATSAEVLRQVRATQRSSTFDAEVESVPSEVVNGLPVVVGYQLLAPHVFAEFDADLSRESRDNPLAGIGTAGPGIFGRETPDLAAGPTLLDGDIATTSPLAKDRSFWYLVFAGYLDARTAVAASDAIVESSLSTATRGTTECAVATFSGTAVAETATLREALTAWAAAAPAEMASSFDVLADGTLQLVSCDPGVGFESSTRPGVARELLSWRAAELATMEAVRVGGGGEAELDEAWAFVQASPVALDLMTLSSEATPTELATAAGDAVTALFTPVG